MLRRSGRLRGRPGRRCKFVREDTEFLAKDGCKSDFEPDLRESGNDGGLCVLAAHEKYDILITGDLSQNEEYRFLSHDLRGIELLVAGHHGAATSTSDALLQRTGASVSSFPSVRTIPTGTRRRRRLCAFKTRARQFTGRMKWEPSSSGEETMAKKQAAAVADTLRQFKQDLKNNTLGNFYIFCGEEAFMRDYYLAELTKSWHADLPRNSTPTASMAQASRRRRFWTRWRPCR